MKEILRQMKTYKYMGKIIKAQSKEEVLRKYGVSVHSYKNIAQVIKVKKKMV